MPYVHAIRVPHVGSETLCNGGGLAGVVHHITIRTGQEKLMPSGNHVRSLLAALNHHHLLSTPAALVIVGCWGFSSDAVRDKGLANCQDVTSERIVPSAAYEQVHPMTIDT